MSNWQFLPSDLKGFEGEARGHLLESAEITRKTADRCTDSILRAAMLIVETYRGDGKVLLCGNGGSAADCQHVAAELMSRLTKDLDRPGLAALALTTDTSFLTAYTNDFGFDSIYARQTQAIGKPKDVLIGISTSGNSNNVVQAVKLADSMGMHTIGLMGEGGLLGELVECPIIIPSRDAQYIQEALLSVEHIICQIVERALFAQPRT